MGSRKNKSDEIESGGMLLMITISLTIILLAFFILLNSIAKDSEEKKKVALGSISSSFDILAEDAPIHEGENDEMVKDPYLLENDYIDFSDLLVNQENLARKIQVMPEKRGSLLRIPAGELFDNDGVNLKTESHELLSALAKVIEKNSYPVDIASHTDKFPLDDRGVVSNREFSMLRALNVLEYLIEKGGVSPKRLNAFGWGDIRPAVFGKTKESREVNERIDLIFVHPRENSKPKGSFIFKDFFFKTFE